MARGTGGMTRVGHPGPTSTRGTRCPCFCCLPYVQGASPPFLNVFYFTNVFYKTYSSPSCRTQKHAPCRILCLLFPTTSPSLQPNTMACLRGHAIVLGCLPSPPTRKMCPIGHVFHVGLPSHPTPAVEYEKHVQSGTFFMLDCFPPHPSNPIRKMRPIGHVFLVRLPPFSTR